jgi:YHS domain-containing protein
VYPYTFLKGDRIVEKVKDLVCGMMIDPKTAAATSEYKGQTYYFCAKGCKVAFDKDPEKYIKGQEET